MHSYGECMMDIDLTIWLSVRGKVCFTVTDRSQRQLKILTIGVVRGAERRVASGEWQVTN